MSMKSRLAVVLFNLGGPDSPEAVRPFLLNLFRDPAILRVPFFVRPFLARLIARRRLRPAQENYALLGGKSPLLELTRRQAEALAAALGGETRCFVAMRYWHPFAADVAREVAAWRPEEVVLLPLYPQYSTTTTGSSLTDWREAAARAGLVARTTTLCCWYDDAEFAAATVALIRPAYAEAAASGAKVRVLFSAHGLPEAIVKSGDPYQFQVEQTVASVLAVWDRAVDYAICYQSRVTPQVWIGPSTEEEIARAGRDGVAVVVVPIAFVSDHSETLVELDVEYRDLALRAGVKAYVRAPAANDDAAFIAALAGLARRARAAGPGLCGARRCGGEHSQCPFALAGTMS